MKGPKLIDQSKTLRVPESIQSISFAYCLDNPKKPFSRALQLGTPAQKTSRRGKGCRQSPRGAQGAAQLVLGKGLGDLQSPHGAAAPEFLPQPRLELEAETNTTAACLWARVPVIAQGVGMTSVVSHGAEATVGGRRLYQR